MVTKVLQITSWVPNAFVAMSKCKRWDTHRVDGMLCTHVKGCLQLKDGVIQIVYKMLWKKMRKNNNKARKTSHIISFEIVVG